MKKLLIIIMICVSMLLSACINIRPISTTVTTEQTTTIETTPATDPTTTAAASTTTEAPTAAITTPAETPPPATESAASETSVLTGTFQGAEWGDYLHITILGDDSNTYSFFVLKYPGIDVETLTVGQKVKVFWKNSDEYLDPPGETMNIDVAVSIELIG